MPLYGEPFADTIFFEYQPIIDLRTGSVAKLEALVRMQHPVHGTLLPDAFLDVIQGTPAMAQLDFLVVDLVCKQIAAWREQGYESVPVAINICASTAANEQLVAVVDAALAKRRLLPQSMEIEVTERVPIDRRCKVARVLTRLRERGVRISLDDFGTGYAALSHAAELPVDALKIDRSFTAGCTRSKRYAAAFKAVVALARSLAMHVTAEGIETDEQLHFACAAGCDFGQGMIFSMPLAARAVPEFTRARFIPCRQESGPAANPGRSA